MPNSLCVTTTVARTRPPPRSTSKASGRFAPASVSSPATASASPPSSTAVEWKAIGWPLSTSPRIVFWISALSSSPRDWMPPVPSSTRSDPASALTSTRASSPTASVASQALTSMSRSCPALAAAPLRPVRTRSVPSSGPSR